MKSPPVNHPGCSMGAASDIALEYPECSRAAIGKRAAGLYIVEPGRRAYVGPRTSACLRRGDSRRLLRRRLRLPARNDFFQKRGGRRADRLHCPDQPRTADAATTSATSAPSETDLAYARAAAADALARGSKDSSVPWENPNTGAGGNITPLAAHNEGSFRLPRFPGELRARPSASLAAGRSLPHRARQVGGQKPQTPQAGLIGC